VNDCDLLAGISDFYLSFFHSTPWIPLSHRVHIWYGKTGMAGAQFGEGRMKFDSVIWAQYINVTDTQTATSPQQLQRQRTASGSNEAK